MRTTINLSEDVHAILAALADREGKPVGAVIDRLVRESRTQYVVRETATKYPNVSRRGAPVTPELVDELASEIGL